MTRNRRTTVIQWTTAALLLLGVALCVVVLFKLSGERVFSLRMAPLAIGAITLCYAIAIVLNSLLWSGLVHAITGINVSARVALVGLAALMIGKYVPGKVVGLIGRGSTLAGKVSPGQAATLTLLEQTYLATGLGLLSVLAAVTQPGLSNWAPAVPAVMLFLAFGPRVVKGFLLRAGLQEQRLHTVLDWLTEIQPLTSLRLMAFALFGAAAVVTVAWFAPILLGMSLEPDVRLALVGAYTLAIAAGMLTLVLPGGIGAREGTFVLLARPWLDPEEALGLAALLRIINVVADLTVGFAGLIALRRTHGYST